MAVAPAVMALELKTLVLMVSGCVTGEMMRSVEAINSLDCAITSAAAAVGGGGADIARRCDLFHSPVFYC